VVFLKKRFIEKFKGAFDLQRNINDSVKLHCLKNKLKGYAYSLIQNLSINNENYGKAIEVLNKEFLDEKFIVDETIKKIISLKPTFDPSYNTTRVYLNEIRTLVYELESYKFKFLEEPAGLLILSHIVLSKLPNVVVREITRKLDTNYPDLNQIFENYNEIIKNIVKTSNNQNKNSSQNQTKPLQNAHQFKPQYRPNVKSNFKQFSPSDNYQLKYRNDINQRPDEPSRPYEKNNSSASLQNFKTFNTMHKSDTTGSGDASGFNLKNSSKMCKFCSSQGHVMTNCNVYEDYTSRVRRCNEIKLCSRCSSSKHSADQCPGLKDKLSFSCQVCNGKNHITALCDRQPQSLENHMCLSQGINKLYLLPTITLKVGKGKKATSIRCLLDSGSQRTYLSKKVLDKLDICMENQQGTSYNIRTYLGVSTRMLKEISLDVYIDKFCFPLPLLIDEDLHLKYEVNFMDTALKNLKNKSYKLADDGFKEVNNSFFELDALLGTDLIEYFPLLELVKCMSGSAFKLKDGSIIPFGNITNFLYYKQVKFPEHSSDMQNENQIKTNQTLVNSVLNPVHSYFSPLSHILTDSEVEQGLENMFRIESLGIENMNNKSEFDLIQIEKFKRGIEFKDGKYHIKLPWIEEKVALLPSNHNIALSVLNRVYDNLKRKNLIEAYNDVFEQQLAEGIIEEFMVSPSEYKNYIWIPHRPVIKTEEQVSTKVRPVFNCSLKVNSLPSINEAAYTGLDLMTSLLGHLFRFRSNQFVMLSDIKQAFLQIKLKSMEDRNRFCFFWKNNGQLKAYRYSTIVFGFTSSPFILNYIIKHHAQSYPDDECTQILLNNFFVDNLIFSGNDPQCLKELYHECNKRMEAGGFHLRSWDSNDEQLRSVMHEDGRIIQHQEAEDKVLGYLYNPHSDKLKLASFSVNERADTKRLLLSAVSKIFDPLNLFLPVTLKGRLLIRKLWQLGLNWDEKVPSDVLSSWSLLCSELNELKNIEIERCAFLPSTSNSLFIFCDASTSCYGFAVYSIGQSSNLIFSKAKVAPLKSRALPSLELLSVFLFFKCIKSILSEFSDVQFKNIKVFVDAQIVLSWLLSGRAKNKNVFVNNRLKEISLIKKQVEQEFKVSISYAYINTAENPADLITRGVSTSTFLSKLPFWLKGPSWILQNQSQWPVSKLKCLSEANKEKTLQCNLSVDVPQSLLPLEDYSSIHKLYRVTSNIFKFINRSKGLDEDSDRRAQLYWLKQMQQQCFSREISFLKNPKKDEIPSIVNQLNLFIDDNGILRSRGRIAKTLLYNYDVINPVLLGKNHHLTRLIIRDFHARCQHLGVQATINFIRSHGFWIAKARQAVKNILSECIICKKFNSIPFKYPKMTNLPHHRVNFVRPFDHTGVDFTGHLFVEDDNKELKKMYLLIYTCLNVRAIHIDVLPDMSAESFLLSFQRFTNVYGIPSSLYSDNARTFKQGGDILLESLSSNMFSEHMRMNNIKHYKIPLYSSWVGSVWERMIRVVKGCLYKTIGKATLTYYQLLTTISNIINVVNSRPLTYRSSENELEVISPNSFLQPYGNSNLIFKEVSLPIWKQLPPSQQDLSITLSTQGKVLETFKQLWYESYLLNLRQTSRNLYQSEWTNRIKVGDIVLIQTPNKPRPFWLLGRVLDVIVGHDSKIRSVLVKRGDGQTCHHSICHLYPLELSITHSVNSGEADDQICSDLANAELADSQEDETSDQIDPSPSNSIQDNGNSAVPDVQPSTSGINSPCQLNSLQTQPQTRSIRERPLRHAAVKCHEFLHRNLSYL